MSVLMEDVGQMGMARLVRVVLSGDAVQAMDGVAMGRMTTVGCRGVASRSLVHVVRNSFIQTVSNSKELVHGDSDHRGGVKDCIYGGDGLCRLCGRTYLTHR
jgi:hypothetical protein